MSKPVGGRGKVAPYETTHVRVPVPLKPKIEKLIEDYREFVVSGSETDFETHSKRPNHASMTTLEEAKGIARQIVKSKQSAIKSLAKLLTALYEGTIDPKELS